jgi:cholesterol transport system auxiliary component
VVKTWIGTVLRTGALAALLALGACSFALRQPAPVKNYFLLEPVAERSTQPPLYPFAIKVSNVEVAPPYQERALVYRLGEQRYDSDFYNQFFVPPRSMVTSQTAQWLGQRQLFTAVLTPASTLDTPYALEGLVNQLYADVRPGTQPAAVFAMQAFLTRVTDRAVVLDRSYSHTVFIPDKAPESVVKGLSDAFAQCLADLERDLRALGLKAEDGAR